jgi:hypothetical protein
MQLRMASMVRDWIDWVLDTFSISFRFVAIVLKSALALLIVCTLLGLGLPRPPEAALFKDEIVTGSIMPVPQTPVSPPARPGSRP